MYMRTFFHVGHESKCVFLCVCSFVSTKPSLPKPHYTSPFIIHPSKRVCPTAMPTRPSARQILSQICGVWSDDKYYNTYTVALDDEVIGVTPSCSVHTIKPSGEEIFSKKLITFANDGRIFWGKHQQYELKTSLQEKPDFICWQSKTGNWKNDFKWKRHEDNAIASDS